MLYKKKKKTSKGTVCNCSSQLRKSVNFRTIIKKKINHK